MKAERLPRTGPKRRVSTLLLMIISTIAALVLLGLIVMGGRLLEIRNDLSGLRNSALPNLIKLAQLSQEASATSSIAPALSSRPSRSEFDTLRSRLLDKESSLQVLIEELGVLIADEEVERDLRANGQALLENLRGLTDRVNEQIAVNDRLEDFGDRFRSLLAKLSDAEDKDPGSERSDSAIFGAARSLGSSALIMISDPNGARLSRNLRTVEKRSAQLSKLLKAIETGGFDTNGSGISVADRLFDLWSSDQTILQADKKQSLANDFRIKALAEENSIAAARLLNSATREFWRASTNLEGQISNATDTARFALVSIFVVIVAFSMGNILILLVLKRRIFERLERINDALRTFAEHRDRAVEDPLSDEIGDISKSLVHYMTVIDERESELAEKSNALEQLSNQLAKYLSPQVYASIFSGAQEVKIASSRKKLTIFFSDIAGFTETADRLESEELTQLLNTYLTEMSRIALERGATIDKYVGDGILIFFGDPETKGVKEDALACMHMALEMRRRMVEFEDACREAGIEKPLKIRIGVHTGYCTVGNFGSEDRMDYTIIGGAVNIASRLEEQAEPGEILISYETFAHVHDAISCEECGAAEVKGIAYPIATYRVLDSYDNLERVRRRFQEKHAHVSVDINLEAMTALDRRDAALVLRRALDLIADDNTDSIRTLGQDNDQDAQPSVAKTQNPHEK